MSRLFWLVASLTALSFGGGQTLLAGLERELVQTGVLDPREFAAAVALGQSTPGPLAAFTTAVGFAVDGAAGAVAATAGLGLVSLGAVLLIGRVPAAWFTLPAVRAALQATRHLAVALAFYLAWRAFHTGPAGMPGPLIILGVAAGRLLGVPVPVLVLAAVASGIALL